MRWASVLAGQFDREHPGAPGKLRPPMEGWGEMAINYEWVLREWDRFLEMSERVKTQDTHGDRPVYRFAASDDEVRQQFSVALLALETIFPGTDFGLPEPERSLAIRVKVMREIVHDAIPQVKRKDEIAANLNSNDHDPIIAADALHPWVWSVSGKAALGKWQSSRCTTCCCYKCELATPPKIEPEGCFRSEGNPAGIYTRASRV